MVQVKSNPVHVCQCFAHWPGKVAAVSSALRCGSFWGNLCWYCIDFLISDPNESFVMFSSCSVIFFPIVMLLQLLQQWEDNMENISNLSFCFSCWMYQNVYSPCVCQWVLCGATFSFPVCDAGMRYCEMVFVQVLQVGYVCVTNYVYEQWLQNKPLALN